MLPRLSIPADDQWPYIHAIVAIALFLLSILGVAFHQLWSSLYSVYYMTATPIFIAFYFYFRRLHDGIELKIFLTFCLWLVVTRILVGDESLRDHHEFLMGMFASCVLFPTGIMLKRKLRLYFLDLVSIIYCTFTTLLGLIGIYIVITFSSPTNPLTGETLGFFQARLWILGQNPNIGGHWFMCGSMLSLYLFFRYRKWYLRLPIVLLYLMNAIGMAICGSRNAMLWFSVCFGFLCFALIIPRLRSVKLLPSVTVFVVLMCLTVPSCYKSFGLTTDILAQAAEKHYQHQNEELSVTGFENNAQKLVNVGTVPHYSEEPFILSATPLSSAKTINSIANMASPNFDNLYRNESVFHDTGRLPIYKAAFLAFADAPQRLAIGCHFNEVMTYAWDYLPREYGHLHNSYLQVLTYAGILGLLLVLSFCLLLAFKMLRLFFQDVVSDRMSICCTCLFLFAQLGYSLLETSLFWSNDMTVLLFFFCAGSIVGFYQDLYSKT